MDGRQTITVIREVASFAEMIENSLGPSIQLKSQRRSPAQTIFEESIFVDFSICITQRKQRTNKS